MANASTARYAFLRQQPGDPAISGNLTITEDGWCYGQIQGDPDIAGWGVFGGILLNATVAVLLSFLVILPQIKVRWKLAGTDFSKIWSILKCNEKQLLTEVAQEHEIDKELTPLETLTLGLGDTSLITGLAIILSSMAKSYGDKQYPLYHLFISRMLASLAFPGYNASNVVYPKLRARKKPSLHVRWFLSTVGMILFLLWNTSALFKFGDWRDYTPSCFSGHLNRGRGTYKFWIHAHYFWIPQTFLWVLLTPFSSLDDVDSVGVRIDILTLFLVRNICFRTWTGLVPRREHSWWRFLGMLLGNVLRAILKTGLVVLYLTLSLFLFPVDTLGPVSNLFLGIVWATYDIVTIKMSNMTAVVYSLQTPEPAEVRNPEMEWGIGQIFPLVMGLQVLLACLDAVFDIHAGEYFYIGQLLAEAMVESEKRQKISATVTSSSNAGHAATTATVSSNITPVARKRTVPQQVQDAHVHG